MPKRKHTKKGRRPHRTSREISALLVKFRSSGWSQDRFSAHHDISRASLCRWLRMEREGSLPGSGDRGTEARAPDPFVEAFVAEGGWPFGSEATAAAYEIELGGARLRIARGFGRKEVGDLLALLVEVRACSA